MDRLRTVIAERLRPAIAGLLLTGLAASHAVAFEAVGTLQRMDAEHRQLELRTNGRDRLVAVATEARILGADGAPLAEGLASPELRAGAEVTLTLERDTGRPVVRTIRLGRAGGRPAPLGQEGRPSTGLKPLNEMTAEDRYKGEDGGLYGGGRNEPPPAHKAAAEEQSRRIVPLDLEGRPADGGRIGLVSISMSNATQEFSRFKQLADPDPRRSPVVTIVDCAQGGQAMAEWTDPNGRPWSEAERRLKAAGIGARQIQVAWIKLANKNPRGELDEHGRQLQRDTLAVLRLAKSRFPNLRIAYLGSRIYGGYSRGSLNPEPYAYEGAFVARWLILAQAQGEADLRYDGTAETARVPLLLWGPYFWADGTTPRATDGLRWDRDDFAGDGTHPSESGRRKVAEGLLTFFTEDALASQWFARRADGPAGAGPNP